jgi:hypothetical protein
MLERRSSSDRGRPAAVDPYSDGPYAAWRHRPHTRRYPPSHRRRHRGRPERHAPRLTVNIPPALTVQTFFNRNGGHSCLGARCGFHIGAYDRNRCPGRAAVPASFFWATFIPGITIPFAFTSQTEARRKRQSRRSPASAPHAKNGSPRGLSASKKIVVSGIDVRAQVSSPVSGARSREKRHAHRLFARPTKRA